jgi:hypothetical protein
MRSYVLLTLVAPLVLALPAPAPAPLPFPNPQTNNQETNVLTGLLAGLGGAVVNLGSILDAIPAVLGDLGTALEAADVVVSKYSEIPQISKTDRYRRN